MNGEWVEWLIEIRHSARSMGEFKKAPRRKGKGWRLRPSLRTRPAGGAAEGPRRQLPRL